MNRRELQQELAMIESHPESPERKARREEIIAILVEVVRCRRCNVPMTEATCRACDNLPYSQQWWKH